MKRLFKRFLLLIPIPISMILINFFYDPAHLYTGGRYEKGIANYLLAGKNVAGVTNYDSHLLQEYYIQGLTGRKDVIVLGSSRSLSLKSDIFKTKSFFNNSINSARIDDYEYVYNLYRDKSLIPRTVVIGVDPWILYRNKSNLKGANTSSIIIKKVGPALTIISHIFHVGITQDKISKYYQLISPSYFQRSFSLFTKSLADSNNSSKYFAISDPNDSRIIKYADGSMNLNTDKKDKEQIRQSAVSYDPIPLLGGFEELDKGLINHFQHFVDLLQSDGVEVIFYLPPFHPITYKNLINSKYGIIIDAQDYFVSLAAKKGIKVFGSYNPQDYNLDESLFADGSHPAELAPKIIFSNYIQK